MKKLRIGMFSWESYHAVKVGGIAPHVTELSEALVRRGHDVHVFTRAGWMQDYDNYEGVHYQRCHHDESGSIVNQMDKMCDAMYERFLSVSRDVGKFDILHCHDWHAVNVLNRIRHDFGIPYLITYHSTEWGRNGNTHGDWWEFGEISHREWNGGYESAKVISTSMILKNEICSLYQIPHEKISIIPNGIVPGKYRMDVDAGKVKEKYGIHPLAPVVLFVGRMAHQKGPDMLVGAIPHVVNKRWDVQFIFAGEGEMRPHCEYLSDMFNVRSNCHFLGYVLDDDLRELVNAADIICMPSRNEPFGIVALEAWDAGKPVIGTDAVDLIDNFRTGIKASKTSESLAWCINDVIDKPDALKWMGEQGREDITNVYNWDIVSEETERVYLEVAGDYVPEGDLPVVDLITIKGIGSKTAKKLEGAGISTIHDLILADADELFMKLGNAIPVGSIKRFKEMAEKIEVATC